MAVEQVGVGGAKSSSTSARPRAVKWLLRLMPEACSRWMAAARPRAASISFATWSDFSRLTGPPQAVPAERAQIQLGARREGAPWAVFG